MNGFIEQMRPRFFEAGNRKALEEGELDRFRMLPHQRAHRGGCEPLHRMRPAGEGGALLLALLLAFRAGRQGGKESNDV